MLNFAPSLCNGVREGVSMFEKFRIIMIQRTFVVNIEICNALSRFLLKLLVPSLRV